ncbi:MerR family transcriptional regulator [Vibrio spartinae]|uniref:HTH-type transcriptional repressor YcgE n=1 Tax=Vibrio spartinae TaxID=1918945 RepID=A0A1N6M8W8_9VIBR|nr:MerR family transcriptional regulator [Vibrio spartinae]QMV16274.1 HTH-type transcriptional repressor YcgE [Vibrio spartinae]SIO95869.1 HTH-type transcriptional repressor YcgE [Vibrio spartinae]
MDSKEKRYAIREVSAITGVKPVTLRAWQRRYHLVEPSRTEKGHRLYSEQDIQQIQQIQSWLAKGISIGNVTQLLQSADSSELELSGSGGLEECESFLSALAQLNRGKAEAVMVAVLKNYPLEIVRQQFVIPVDEALVRMKSSQQSIQRGLFQAMLTGQFAWMITTANRASHLGKCLCVSLDPVGSIWAWLHALQIAEQGYFTALLDGVDELSGLLEHASEGAFQRIDFFSNRALTSKQQQVVRQLQQLQAQGADLPEQTPKQERELQGQTPLVVTSDGLLQPFDSEA